MFRLPTVLSAKKLNTGLRMEGEDANVMLDMDFKMELANIALILDALFVCLILILAKAVIRLISGFKLRMILVFVHREPFSTMISSA